METKPDNILLMEAFERSNLPAGHIRAFKEGAAYGYLKAKREVVDLIDLRLESPNERVASALEDGELVKLRHYIRNVMLWKTDDGRHGSG